MAAIIIIAVDLIIKGWLGRVLRQVFVIMISDNTEFYIVLSSTHRYPLQVLIIPPREVKLTGVGQLLGQLEVLFRQAVVVA